MSNKFTEPGLPQRVLSALKAGGISVEEAYRLSFDSPNTLLRLKDLSTKGLRAIRESALAAPANVLYDPLGHDGFLVNQLVFDGLLSPSSRVVRHNNPYLLKAGDRVVTTVKIPLGIAVNFLTLTELRLVLSEPPRSVRKPIMRNDGSAWVFVGYTKAELSLISKR